MLKFRITHSNGRIGIGIGLSQENWEKLLEGQPIMFSGESLKIDGIDFLIMGANTEEDLAHVAEYLFQRKAYTTSNGSGMDS